MKVTESNFNRVARLADDIANDEQVTRKRVDMLERGVTAQARLLARGFWGRLRWLVLGK